MNAIPKRGTLDLEQPIYDRLCAAIASGKLPSGLQLTEETLASVFDVSRARIRKVLSKLHQDHLVDLIPNRGAFVARPNRQETAQVMEARRMIEADICRQLCQRSAADRNAVARDVRRQLGKAKAPQGTFHLALARLSGNDILLEFLEGLMRRSSLISAAYLPDDLPFDPADEHALMLEQMLQGDAQTMAHTMSAHLQRLEMAFDFNTPRKHGVRLEDVLAD